MISEDQLEQLCFDCFREGRYEYAYRLDVAYDSDRKVTEVIAP